MSSAGQLPLHNSTNVQFESPKVPVIFVLGEFVNSNLKLRSKYFSTKKMILTSLLNITNSNLTDSISESLHLFNLIKPSQISLKQAKMQLITPCQTIGAFRRPNCIINNLKWLFCRELRFTHEGFVKAVFFENVTPSCCSFLKRLSMSRLKIFIPLNKSVRPVTSLAKLYRSLKSQHKYFKTTVLNPNRKCFCWFKINTLWDAHHWCLIH